jgi:hypothetical protein
VSETTTAEPVATEAPAPDAADDLRAAIGAAFDEHGDTPDTDTATQRDERGRFAGAERDATDAPAEPEKAEAPAEPEPLSPPATLGADDISRWATLPREHQEWIAAREAKAHETVRALEPVQTVLKQYEPLYAARGIAAPQAMAALFEAQRMLETRPHEAIAVLARQYGVQMPDANAANPSNTAHSALEHKVQQLEAKLAEREQAAEVEARQTIESTIRDFAAKPEHRHFPTVRTYMGALMQADPALDLARAYEMACRAHPEISKSLSAEAEKAEAARKAKAAQEAMGKRVSVRGSPPISGAGRPPDDLRGVLSAAWDGNLH